MNENEIERQLQRAPLAQPSADLDRRIQTLFHEAANARPHPLERPVPVWLAAAACLVCAVAGFGMHALAIRPSQPTAVVYVLQPDETLSRFLQGKSSRRSDSLDLSHARIHVATQPIIDGNQL